MLAGLLPVVTGGCTVIPPHVFPPSEEREVVVTFEGGLTDGVRVPASRDGLTVLWVRTDPAGVRESFHGGERRFHAGSRVLTVRCRYRVYGDDRAALPEPEQLFPDAASIRTIEVQE